MNHREMKALAENLEAVRSLAGFLLALAGADPQVAWSDWERDFLEGMADRETSEPLTLRQVEKLVELRDDARSFESLDGLSVPSLIAECWANRLDLDEEDEAFIDGLKASGSRSIKYRQAQKLIACAKRLGVVEGYIAIGRT